MTEYWNVGMMGEKGWNDGILEYWNNGLTDHADGIVEYGAKETLERWKAGILGREFKGLPFRW
jgi:hypothetical protein